MNCRKIESAQGDVNNPVRPEDDHQSYKTPDERLLPYCAFCRIACMHDKLEPAPKESNKRNCRKKQDNRIDYLYDNLTEKAIKRSEHRLITANINTSLWCAARHARVIAKADRTRENVDQAPD